MLDLYSDYLLSSFQQTTATGLSSLTDGDVSHDKVSKFLNKNDYGSKELWQEVKPLVREHQSEDACLIFDDTIVEKPYTDESELICWHCRVRINIHSGTNQRLFLLLSTLQPSIPETPVD